MKRILSALALAGALALTLGPIGSVSTDVSWGSGGGISIPAL